MTGSTSLRLVLASSTALAAFCALPGAAFAQTTDSASTPTGAATPIADDQADKGKGNDIIITGSRIKQDPNNSALPLTIITNTDLNRNSISSPEQLIMFLPSNGSGADNLASNSDVTTGAQRGTNGLSAANLRGQGSAATLVLLNGRRVAAHGLSGSAVDVNQIPFAAIDRIEILKDGASAIYGTDAVGGVINFITKKNFRGLSLQGFTDFTERGDSPIYRLSGVIGYGDLAKDGFNVMAAASYSWAGLLRGEDRDFVTGNQPSRGLSVDTRGTPIATAFNIGANANTPGFAGGTLLSGLTITAPNGANAAAGGINPLDLPGGGGCTSMDGGMDYDYLLWNAPTAYYACSWDTGRAAALQQPIKTLTYYGRGVVKLGASELSLEVTGSKADSAKSFSNAQLSANTTNLSIGLPRTAATAATYDAIVNSIRSIITVPSELAAFNVRAAQNLPISFRWRCVACGPREYKTDTKTFRVAGGLEGPLPLEGWDYRVGASYARSESSSLLGSGYYYRGTLANGAADPLAPTAPGATFPGLVGLINSGLINPFTLSQSAAGIAGLNAISAAGTTLYGGKYEVKQFDGSVSGPLFRIWGGDVQIAAGVDYRRETYSFNGSAAAAATAPVIFLAAFDNVNALTPKSRTVKAAYGEVLVPLLPGLDLTGAVRIDDYTGFGTTTNPKLSIKFRPIPQILFRGSYNTSFRVPTFNQIFNGVTLSPYAGSDLADPVACPGGVPTAAFGSGLPCAIIRPDIATGGTIDLKPETAKQFNAGVVFQPFKNLSLSVDWWSIAVDNTIQLLTLRQLIDNASLFPDRFIRANGTVTTIDDRWINAGSRRTQGLEFTYRGSIPAFGGTLSSGLDGSLLLKKREKLTPTSAYGGSLVGVFTFAGDLGVKWKHNAFIAWSDDKLSLSISQIFRKGYKNFAIGTTATGSVSRPDYNPFVKDYIIYNLSVGYNLAPGYKITAGVKNLFDTDPPFAITYDGNTGAGSSWEPRVADPRGRSFTMNVEVKF